MPTYCFENDSGGHIHKDFLVGKAPDYVVEAGVKHKRVFPCGVTILLPTWSGTDNQREEFYQADLLEKELSQ